MRCVALLVAICAGLAGGLRAEAAIDGRQLLLALIGNGTTASVAWLDPVTLRPVARQRQVYVGLHDIPYSFSPDGSLLALGSGRTSSLVVIDVRRMRLVGRLETRFTAALAWLTPHLLALVESRLAGDERRLGVTLVDPRGRAVEHFPLPNGYDLIGVVGTHGSAVLLLMPTRTIAAPLHERSRRRC